MMLILGTGTDLCRIDRIRRSYRRFGDAWLDEVFTPYEQALGLATRDQGLWFAQAFCSKEACAKALCTGFSQGVTLRSIEVFRRGARADICLHDGASDCLTKMSPPYHRAEFHLTVSSDDQFALAVACLIAVPDASTLGGLAPNLAKRVVIADHQALSSTPAGSSLKLTA